MPIEIFVNGQWEVLENAIAANIESNSYEVTIIMTNPPALKSMDGVQLKIDGEISIQVFGKERSSDALILSVLV